MILILTIEIIVGYDSQSYALTSVELAGEQRPLRRDRMIRTIFVKKRRRAKGERGRGPPMINGYPKMKSFQQAIQWEIELPDDESRATQLKRSREAPDERSRKKSRPSVSDATPSSSNQGQPPKTKNPRNRRQHLAVNKWDAMPSSDANTRGNRANDQ